MKCAFLLCGMLLGAIAVIVYGGNWGGGGEQALLVRATVFIADGTTADLDDVRINNTTELMAYTKPKTVLKKNNGGEYMLELNPADNKTGPFQLRNTKTIKVFAPPMIYLYQEGNNGLKSHFIEIEIDGMSYLIRKNWTVTGTDEQTRKPRTIEFHIIEKIVITGTHPKTDQVVQPCECPASQ